MNLLIIGDYSVATPGADARPPFRQSGRSPSLRPMPARRISADAEVVIPEHVLVDDAFLAQAPRLRFVQVGAGYDNVDLAACTVRRGRAGL